MRVLQLSGGLSGDGGAIAVQRLDTGLRQLGVDSIPLVLASQNLPAHAMTFRRGRTRLERWLDRASRRVLPALGLDELVDASSFRILDDCVRLGPDVVTVHGPTYQYLSPLVLSPLSRRFPTVLVLHDMWSFTGHCSHSFDCSRWQSGCGRCPLPEAEPRVRRDATALAWRIKDWTYARSALTVVAPSEWMAERARASMLGRFPVERIPHGVDVETYRPLDRETCRRALDIAPDRLVLLFMAANLARTLKGADLLAKALAMLPEALRRRIVLLLVGGRGQTLAKTVPVDVVDLGFVSSERLKAVCLAAADLYVHPSRAEVFPYVVLESLACGTPVVAFRVGGIPDAVRPGLTGELAEPEDAAGLARGIQRLLDDPGLREHLRQRARAVAVEEFSLRRQAERYLTLYERLLGHAPGPAEALVQRSVA